MSLCATPPPPRCCQAPVPMLVLDLGHFVLPVGIDGQAHSVTFQACLSFTVMHVSVALSDPLIELSVLCAVRRRL